jgi:hypothetical protein
MLQPFNEPPLDLFISIFRVSAPQVLTHHLLTHLEKVESGPEALDGTRARNFTHRYILPQKCFLSASAKPRY